MPPVITESFRRLNESDIELVDDLWRTATTVFKQPFVRTRDFAERFIQSENFELYGSFSEDKLQATIGIRLWGAMPYFTLLNMVYRENTFSAVQSARHMNLVLVQILDSMHRSGRFTFFITTLTRARQLRRFREENIVSHSKYFAVLDSYDVHVEEVFAPGESSSYRAFDSLLGQRQHSHEVWIRRYTLRAENRKKYLGQYKK